MALLDSSSWDWDQQSSCGYIQYQALLALRGLKGLRHLYTWSCRFSAGKPHILAVTLSIRTLIRSLMYSVANNFIHDHLPAPPPPASPREMICFLTPPSALYFPPCFLPIQTGNKNIGQKLINWHLHSDIFISMADRISSFIWVLANFVCPCPPFPHQIYHAKFIL